MKSGQPAGGARRIAVDGVGLDSESRCVHYHDSLDIVAIKMKCCGRYYACKDCHDELAGHALEVWPRSEWDQPAVLCGACGTELAIDRYLACNSRCPNCNAAFNPKCGRHWRYYFSTA